MLYVRMSIPFLISADIMQTGRNKKACTGQVGVALYI